MYLFFIIVGVASTVWLAIRVKTAENSPLNSNQGPGARYRLGLYVSVTVILITVLVTTHLFSNEQGRHVRINETVMRTPPHPKMSRSRIFSAGDSGTSQQN